MKKLYFAVCIGLFASCGSDEVLTVTEESQPISVGSEFRSPSEILTIATEALQDCYPATRAARSIRLENVSFVKSPATRGELNDSLLYVVNVPDDGGFVLVLGNRGFSNPVLAVTEGGNITDVESIEIPGLKMYVESALAYASAAPSVPNPPTPPGPPTPQPPSAEIRKYIFASEREEVAPRINLNWTQSGVAGQFCPNKVAGCVPLAGAIALSYFKTPASLTLTYPGKDVNKATFNWEAMLGIGMPVSQTPDALEDAQLDLGRLCRQIGYDIGAKYDTNTKQTAANISNLRPWIINHASGLTISALQHGLPNARAKLGNGLIIMAAVAKEDNSKAHAFIIDGYRYIYENYQWQTRDVGSTIWRPISEEIIDEMDQHHIHWGYGYTTAPGYYNLKVFKCDIVEPEYNYTANPTFLLLQNNLLV